MIQLQNICVKYSYKEVLKNVNLTFEKKQIYALLGENGAGKSTLAHILCGDIKPNSGKIFLDNREVVFESPKQALKYKIACVHQRPLLSDEVSIKENLLLGTSEKSKTLNQKIPELLNLWMPGINPKTKVKNLSLSQKFFVSLVGVLLKDPDFIILDEPTALLDNNQKQLLFSNIKQLCNTGDKGKTILIITHNFDEAIQQSTQVILLKSGNVESQGDASSYTAKNISEFLFGAQSSKSQINKIPNSTLIHSHSILQMELYEEQLVKYVSKNRKKAIAFVPADRTYTAANPNLNILQITNSYKTELKSKEQLQYCKNLLNKAKVNIKPEEKASALSGGMLQKIILTRELEENPSVLFLCEPLQGLDINACRNLYEILAEQGKKGTKIYIFSSSDFPADLCTSYINENCDLFSIFEGVL